MFFRPIYIEQDALQFIVGVRPFLNPEIATVARVSQYLQVSVCLGSCSSCANAHWTRVCQVPSLSKQSNITLGCLLEVSSIINSHKCLSLQLPILYLSGIFYCSGAVYYASLCCEGFS